MGFVDSRKARKKVRLFRRRLDQKGRLAPQEWRQGHRSRYLSCPACGILRDIRDVAVAADGSVKERVRCGDEGCSWQDWVRLDGWDDR